MKDTQNKDRRHARAVRMLDAYGALPESQERMNRVRRALRNAEPRRASWLVWLSRPAVALSLLLGLAAVAGATVGRAPLARALDDMSRRLGMSTEAPATPVATPPAAHGTRSGLRAQLPAPPAAMAPAPAAPVSPALPALKDVAPVAASAPATAVTSAARGPSASTVHPPRREAPSAPALQPTPEEESMVYSALTAYRNKNDAAGACAQFEQYLRRYPQGALVEEALAGWIQAATVHDPARAVMVAETYRRKYPSGKWIAIANQALSGTPR